MDHSSQSHFGEDYSLSAPQLYERYFVPAIARPLATDLLAMAALRPGERVLDVACGTGVVARMAAQQVGPEGEVVGADLNPGMLEVARSVAPPGMSITWHEASAESLPVHDESFDVALCQISLQFFPDKLAALREMWRILAPGGRVVLNVPGHITEIFEALADGMRRHIHPDLGNFVRQVFSLPDPGELAGLLREAGFTDVSAESRERSLPLPKPRDFLWQYVHSTPLGSAVAKAEEKSRSSLESEMVEKWQPFVVNGGMDYKQEVIAATGRKPL